MGYGYSLFVLSEPALDGTGSSAGIYGWSGHHNMHFWIDYERNIYGLFMTRTVPFAWEIQKQFRAAVYRGLRWSEFATKVAIAEEVYMGRLEATVQHRMCQYLNSII